MINYLNNNMNLGRLNKNLVQVKRNFKKPKTTIFNNSFISITCYWQLAKIANNMKKLPHNIELK